MFTPSRRFANEDREIASASTCGSNSNKSSCNCGCIEKVLPVIKELTVRIQLIEANHRQINNPITTADILNHFEDCISKKKITGSSFVTLLKTHAPNLAALRLVSHVALIITIITIYIFIDLF